MDLRFLPAAAAVCLLAACASTTAGHGVGAGVAPTGSSAPTAGSSAGASAGASAAASPSAPTSRPAVPSRPLRTVTARAQDGGSYVVHVWADRTMHDCPAHAYGKVVQFLHHHPCTAMRSVLASTTVGGRQVGFAQRSIGFRGATDASYRAAGQFRDLVSRNGTGNLDDLLREGYRLPGGPTSVPFPNAFSALAQDDGVTVTEAWYLHGVTPDNDRALVTMERDIFLQV